MASRIYVTFIGVLWLSTTFIGLALLIGPYVKVYQDIRNDTEMIMKNFKDTSNILNNIGKLFSDVDKIVNEINDTKIWLNLKEKNINIFDEFSNVFILNDTKKLINQTNKDNYLKNVDEITKSFKNDTNKFTKRWKKKMKLFNDIGFLYTNIEKLVDEIEKDIILVIKDIKLIFGHINLINNLETVFKNIRNNLIPILHLKRKYQNRVSILFVKQLGETNASIKYKKENVGNGIIIVLHSCYYFNIDTNIENGIQSFINDIKAQLNMNKLKTTLLDNQDVSITMKQDGLSGKEIEVCPLWGRNQRIYTILFGILIGLALIISIILLILIIIQCLGGNQVKFGILGIMIIFVIISITTMIITLIHKTRNDLSPAGKKYYDIYIPQYADKYTVLSVITFFIGYLLTFLLSIANVVFN
uniref:Uncharacterized protein n=1 Tax=Strongyloides stercoralis TaxID=6248 RepID=A0A0K0EJJ4_STRER